MASDNRANYFTIGLIVLLGALGIAGTLIYIGGLKGRGDELLVETYYDKPVGGLSVGSAVNFRGVRLGEVREICFVGNKYDVEGLDNSRIYILMSLQKSVFQARSADRLCTAQTVFSNLQSWIRSGLRATVSVNGITGIAKIDLDVFPDETDELPKLSSSPEHLLIPPKISLLENFSESATKVMNQINKMDLNAFWSNVNSTVESLSATTLSSQHLLESYQPELERMVKNLEEASSAVRDFTETVRRNPATLLRGDVPEPLTETR